LLLQTEQLGEIQPIVIGVDEQVDVAVRARPKLGLGGFESGDSVVAAHEPSLAMRRDDAKRGALPSPLRGGVGVGVVGSEAQSPALAHRCAYKALRMSTPS
jgi:hypothetical protein